MRVSREPGVRRRLHCVHQRWRTGVAQVDRACFAHRCECDFFCLRSCAVRPLARRSLPPASMHACIAAEFSIRFTCLPPSCACAVGLRTYLNVTANVTLAYGRDLGGAVTLQRQDAYALDRVGRYFFLPQDSAILADAAAVAQTVQLPSKCCGPVDALVTVPFLTRELALLSFAVLAARDAHSTSSLCLWYFRLFVCCAVYSPESAEPGVLNLNGTTARVCVNITVETDQYALPARLVLSASASAALVTQRSCLSVLLVCRAAGGFSHGIAEFRGTGWINGAAFELTRAYSRGHVDRSPLVGPSLVHSLSSGSSF